jgi:hypothetical protein
MSLDMAIDEVGEDRIHVYVPVRTEGTPTGYLDPKQARQC